MSQWWNMCRPAHHFRLHKCLYDHDFDWTTMPNRLVSGWQEEHFYFHEIWSWPHYPPPPNQMFQVIISSGPDVSLGGGGVLGYLYGWYIAFQTG